MITEGNDNAEQKRCRDCRELKPLDAFPRMPRRSDGRGSYCKACFAIRYRDHRVRKAAATGRTVKHRRQLPLGQKWCPACESAQPTSNFPSNRSTRDGFAAYCKPCHNAIGKAIRERLHGSTREYHLRRRYGLTSADVEAMIEAQGGTCATCDGKPEHVDHDHAHRQGPRRPLLPVQPGLGNVRDDVVRLHSLSRYLRRHSPASDVRFESRLEVALDELLHGPAA